MNTNDVCPFHPISSKPLPVRLDPFPVDKRAVYVHSICSVLLDSRFGPRRREPFVVHYSEHPESVVDLDVLCDLTNKDRFLAFTASSAAEANTARRRVSIRVRSHVSSSHVSKGSSSDVSTHDQTIFPQTNARGSPLGISGTHVSPAAANSWQSLGALIFENIWDA